MGCLLVASGEILLALRQNTGRHDGSWSLPGGRVEPGETAKAAIVREAREELGIAVDPEGVRSIDVVEDGSLAVRSFVFHEWEGKVTNCEPEHCAELRWWSRDEIPKTTQTTQDTLDSYFDG